MKKCRTQINRRRGSLFYCIEEEETNNNFQDLEKNQPISPLQQYHWSDIQHARVKMISKLAKAMNIKTHLFIKHFIITAPIASALNRRESILLRFLEKIQFYIFLKIQSSNAKIQMYFYIKNTITTI